MSILQQDSGNHYLNSLRDGTLGEGLDIGCELDIHLRFKEGKLNVMMGQANVGKTDFILWYFVALSKRHKIRWLVFSSENSIGSLKRKIIQFKTGLELTNIDEKTYNDANAWLNTKFSFVDTDHLYAIGDLLEIFKKEKDTYDAMVIDPYNSLKKNLQDTNAHEYDYEMATLLRIFCNKHQKTCYIIAHAVTESLRKTHKDTHQYANLPIPPNASDIEGGGKWVNRADDFIVIHRYVQSRTDWMDTHIHVRKVKETETGGKPTFIDEPVVLKRMYEKFLVKGIDPLTTKNFTPKEQPKQLDLIELGEKKEDNENWDKMKYTPDEKIGF